MKKAKIALLAIAVVGSLGTALAFKAKHTANIWLYDIQANSFVTTNLVSQSFGSLQETSAADLNPDQYALSYYTSPATAATTAVAYINDGQ